ncbi:MAG: serine hydrolase [Saprospiraceae bacterium]
MNKLKNFFITGLLFISYPLASQVADFPEEHWLMYQQPAEAGFDESQLSVIKEQFEAQGGSTFFVVQGGKVVLAWGEPHRRYLQASIRKSYLSALYGIFKEKGNIDLHQTLDNLGIDDLQALTATEKQAKVIDLLSAKSGIYLPSAYAPQGMLKNLPERGAHLPGTFWFYNNWDFNALATIFHQQTNQDLFASFQKRIAKPLQMEDFRLFDTYYRYEKDKSIHPAYLFKMSARDMARFGLLFLKEGRWKDQQLIPGAWVKESTSIHTPDLGPQFGDRGAYGLLWWITTLDNENTCYYASGAGGQQIYVIPSQDMVVVHLVDTYQNKNVNDDAVQSLLNLLIQAKTGTPKQKASFQILPIPKAETPQAIDLAAAQKVVGAYSHPFLKKISIAIEDGQLVLQTGVGEFKLFSQGDDQYMIEDINFPLVFKVGTAEQKGKSESIIGDKRTVEKVILYY